MKQQQTVIFLVRHGKADSVYVRDVKVDGKRRLTNRGKEQSKINGIYLKAFSPAVIFSSPMKRTLETAEIIRDKADIHSEVVVEKELHEIYDDASWRSIATRLPSLFQRLVAKHTGKQIVCVSHQDVIEGSLRALGATDEEADFPCQMGQMYRLVFAGEKFVQATKLNPSKSK